MASFEITALVTRLCNEGKNAAISKLAYILRPSIRSYIVLALGLELERSLLSLRDL